MLRIKIIHKLILGFLSIVILFSMVTFYTNITIENSSEEISRAIEIYDVAHHVNVEISKLFDLTRDYVTIEHFQDVEDFRSQWVSHLYGLNLNLSTLGEAGIEPNSLSTIEERVDTGGEISENLIDNHNLILATSDSDALARLKEKEQVYLMDMLKIQEDTEKVVKVVEKESRLRVNAAIENSKRIVSISNTLLLLAYATTLIFVVLITFSISRPISRLIKGVESVEKGNFDVKVGTKSGDEIGELSRAFDKMALSINRSQKGMREYNLRVRKDVDKRTKEIKDAKKNLEKTVRDRTSELEAAKKELQSKVLERTEELNSKVKDLERFNKLAVGRELEMIKLKKKVRDMESKR